MFDLGSEYGTTDIPTEDVATIQVVSDGWHKGESQRMRMMVIVEFVICPMVDKCQMACDGICANTKIFSHDGPCPWATCKSIKSKEHSNEMMDEISNHPRFEKLMPRQSRRFAIIGDHAYVNLGLRHRSDTTMGGMFDNEAGILDERLYDLDLGLPLPIRGLTGIVPLSSLTPEVMARLLAGDGFKDIFKYGGPSIMAEYRNAVSQFLTDVRRCWPDGYEAFVNRFPEYSDLPVSNVGRYAKVATCPDGATFESGEVSFTKRGACLETSTYSSYIHALGTYVRNAMLRIDITDRLIIKITDESQVDPEHTVFV